MFQPVIPLWAGFLFISNSCFALESFSESFGLIVEDYFSTNYTQDGLDFYGSFPSDVYKFNLAGKIVHDVLITVMVTTPCNAAFLGCQCYFTISDPVNNLYYQCRRCRNSCGEEAIQLSVTISYQ